MQKKSNLVTTADGRSFLIPFILITTLFFLWGFAHSILDVLNKHFQDALNITKARSALVQAAVYGGYFLMAIPAGNIIRRFGYRTGVLAGLILYGIGALLFIPGGKIMSFEFFLVSLFIIGCGLTCLETAANPYVTVLGERESAERRINLAQSFNGFGWICGPLVGGLFLFSADGESGDISTPYAIIGVVVLLVAIFFSRIKLPEIEVKEDVKDADPHHTTTLWEHRNFKFGLIVLFLYVAAQTGINSFFINYATENAGISAREASLWLSFAGMGLFMAGRMGGSWIMGFFRAERLLTFCGIGAALAIAVIILGEGMTAVGAFFFCFLCESIMFPTIFALAIRGVGGHTKRASSFLVMSVVGGAVAPLTMGYIADVASTATSFVIPLACFFIITAYGMKYRNLLNQR